MKRNGILLLLWAASVVLTLTLLGAALWFGDVNQDEGWYLYAGRMVAEGNLPFIDFASTQGPSMAVVYAAAWPLVERWGVAGGRLFTALLALACMAAAVGLAGRLARIGPRPPGAGQCAGPSAGSAALMCLILIGINVYQATFFTVVKTYALSGGLLVLGFVALTHVRGRHGWVAAALCGLLLTLAASVRLSAAVATPIVFFVLLCSPGVARPSAALGFAAGVGVTGSLVFLPFVLKAPAAFWFGMLEYHAAREVGGLFNLLAYKAGFVARLFRAYLVALGCLGAGLIWKWCRRAAAGAARPRRLAALHADPFRVALWVTVLGVSGLHALAAFPYDDYQVMIFPLLAVGLALWLAEIGGQMEAWRSRFRVAPSLVLVLILLGLHIAAALASPIVQDWFIGKQDVMWWPVKTQTPLERLREAGRLVRSLAGPDRTVLTQDTYLAVEAGLRVPRGMELGPFSYYPDWSRAKADACHVLNNEKLREVLQSAPANVAAFSGYGLAIASPAVTPLADEARRELWRAVHQHYRLHAVVDAFGQAGTPLRVLVRERE